MSEVRWRSLLQWAAVAAVVELIVVMAVVEKSVIPPAAIIGLLLAVGVVLLRGEGPRGNRFATVVFVLFLLTNGLFAGKNLTVPASFGSFVLTWMAILTGVVGVAAGVACWRGREPSATAPRLVFGAVGLTVVAIVVGLVASLGYNNAKEASGDTVIRAKDSKFTPTVISAPAGSVSFFVDNGDNTLHNLHIVGVKGGTKDVPANHKTRLTVTLKAGAYKYKCDYHSDMKGTITVS